MRSLEFLLIFSFNLVAVLTLTSFPPHHPHYPGWGQYWMMMLYVVTLVICRSRAPGVTELIGVSGRVLIPNIILWGWGHNKTSLCILLLDETGVHLISSYPWHHEGSQHAFLVLFAVFAIGYTPRVCGCNPCSVASIDPPSLLFFVSKYWLNKSLLTNSV